MIHRYRINRNKLLGPDGNKVTGATMTFISGLTIPTMPNVYKTTSVTFNQNRNLKNLVLPLNLKFEPMDYSDLIDSWVNSETQKAINRILDGEKVRYLNRDLEIEFRFLDRNTNTYSVTGPTNSFTPAGFDLPLDYSFNRYKKSFFRLYFYDTNSGETANLMFVEDFMLGNDYLTPKVKLNRLFWDKDDELMKTTTNNRILYMEARFFNAKTGQIQTFNNIPLSYTSPISITEYSNITNREWRTSPIALVNPNTINGNYKFIPINGVGANQPNKITLSEFILS
jgi:hypothetical protein